MVFKAFHKGSPLVDCGKEMSKVIALECTVATSKECSLLLEYKNKKKNPDRARKFHTFEKHSHQISMRIGIVNAN